MLGCLIKQIVKETSVVLVFMVPQISLKYVVTLFTLRTVLFSSKIINQPPEKKTMRNIKFEFAQEVSSLRSTSLMAKIGDGVSPQWGHSVEWDGWFRASNKEWCLTFHIFHDRCVNIERETTWRTLSLIVNIESYLDTIWLLSPD